MILFWMMWECFGMLHMSKILDFSHGDPQTTSMSPRCEPAVIDQDSFFGPGEVGTQEAMVTPVI